jgi:hypothetical protein
MESMDEMLGAGMPEPRNEQEQMQMMLKMMV